MATNNMHNFTTLIKRLEAATARLEDIASSTIDLTPTIPVLKETLASPQSGLSGASTPGPNPPAASAPSAPSAPATPTPPPAIQLPPEPLPESIEEFDTFLNGPVDKFSKLSQTIGGLVDEQALKVVQGFKEQRKFLLITTKSKKPDLSGAEMSVYQNLLTPINEALMAVNNIKESNRGAPVFHQLSAVSEGIIVLAWVTVDTRPYKHVEESLGSAQFFGNRVLKEFKESDPQQVEWVQSFYQIFKDLAEYVKNYFPNGIPWNPQGLAAQDVVKALSTQPAASAPAAPPAGGAGAPPPPPPPPGPPPVLQINDAQPEPTAAGGLNAVFSELNKGEAVTKGLKKVDKSQMTHKNPSLRASSTVTDGGSSQRGKSPAPARKPKPESMRVKKPPKKELEGNKWTIENFEKEAQPIEIEASIAHSILISRCTNTTIIIKGKANAVNVDNTNRLSLVVDSLVSTVDVVKSNNFALQVMGAIPTVMMDQVDGAQVYLSKESIGTRIYSSKSAGINLNVLAGAAADGEEEDYKEVPLPSQLCSYWDGEKKDLVNEIVSHAG